MKKIISSTLAVVAFGLAANSVLASDYADEVKDIQRSVSAIKKQLDLQDVQYNEIKIENGLNRSQKVKALELKYDYLRNQL
ncbi:hypothetical protein [Marinomonas sp. MED121]|uniref:hypothetical protein n=1 Tax=Marinomonas sp. MED121 TaxID=314277 RepID=UPI0003051AF8|nr:hypothetical protein [Marinomonas sp. MED121]